MAGAALGPSLLPTATRPRVDAILGLRTRELSGAFRDTTSSYKFFWFLAIIDLLPALDRPVAIDRIIQAMVVRAWAAVVLFRLSLGKVDRLQDCVHAFCQASGLPSRASAQRLSQALTNWSELSSWVDELTRFVPGRFLGAWFPEIARSTPYDRRGARDVAVAADRAWGTVRSAPYRLVEDGRRLLVELAPGWRDWLDENRALVLGFTELQLTRYLQARNPSVPAIVRKLELPRRRSLVQARQWWYWAIGTGEIAATHDIFTGLPLGDRFEIDHFLPWSFVAHDEFWNLCPVMPGVNRDKSDALPALNPYLPRLAALHSTLLARPDLPYGLAQAYGQFLGIGADQLPSVSPQLLEHRYTEVVGPLAQIAANQGFPANWRWDNQHPGAKGFYERG